MKRKLVVLVAAPAAAEAGDASAGAEGLRAFLQPLTFAQAFSSQQVNEMAPGAAAQSHVHDCKTEAPHLPPAWQINWRAAHPCALPSPPDHGRRPCALRSRCGRGGTSPLTS